MPEAKGLRLQLTRSSVALVDDMDAPHLEEVNLPFRVIGLMSCQPFGCRTHASLSSRASVFLSHIDKPIDL